jgi:YHS domain-containing protein
MKVKYLAAIATATVITLGFAGTISAAITRNSLTTSITSVKVAVCAGKPNPCASKVNPCASKVNPCASKVNPCASKVNPCAGKAAKATRNPAYYTENGVALDGQDVVSYFTDKKLVMGKKNFSYKWQGANWVFSSAAHRDLFAQNPEKYAPAYGGYCAKAASDGNLATTEANSWEVRGGKLYLNYSAEAQKEWLQDTSKKIVLANQNFPKILNNETLYK